MHGEYNVKLDGKCGGYWHMLTSDWFCCSKTVADLKVRFPSLQEGMKGLLASEMEKVVREEK
jgi:hypothetical protein